MMEWRFRVGAGVTGQKWKRKGTGACQYYNNRKLADLLIWHQHGSQLQEQKL